MYIQYGTTADGLRCCCCTVLLMVVRPAADYILMIIVVLCCVRLRFCLLFPSEAINNFVSFFCFKQKRNNKVFAYCESNGQSIHPTGNFFHLLIERKTLSARNDLLGCSRTMMRQLSRWLASKYLFIYWILYCPLCRGNSLKGS